MATCEYSDDPTIPNDADLWRWIPPKQVFFDENRGHFRPSTAAFRDHPNGSPMSVLLAHVVLESGRGANDVLSNLEGYALTSIKAGLARECGQGIKRAPLPGEPAHAEVFGNKTYAVRKKLVEGSCWLVLPSGV